MVYWTVNAMEDTTPRPITTDKTFSPLKPTKLDLETAHQEDLRALAMDMLAKAGAGPAKSKEPHEDAENVEPFPKRQCHGLEQDGKAAEA